MSNVFQYLATRLSWAKVDPSIVVILNYSRPTLNLLKLREEFCHRVLQTTKAQTSLRIRAVWSAPLLFTNWIVSYLFTILSSLSGWECWFWYDRIGNTEDRFCRIDAHLYSCKCGPNPQACFTWYAHRKCLAPLDYSWPIPPMTNADGIRTKNSTHSPSAPLNTPFSSGKDVGIKRTFFI